MQNEVLPISSMNASRLAVAPAPETPFALRSPPPGKAQRWATTFRARLASSPGAPEPQHDEGRARALSQASDVEGAGQQLEEPRVPDGFSVPSGWRTKVPWKEQ